MSKKRPRTDDDPRGLPVPEADPPPETVPVLAVPADVAVVEEPATPKTSNVSAIESPTAFSKGPTAA